MFENFNIVSLTPVQEGMLFHSLEKDNDDVYVTNFTLSLLGTVDEERLNEAWNRVVTEHQALRTIYRWTGLSQPVQIIFAQRKNNIEFRHDPTDAIKAGQTLNVSARIKNTEIDLETNPIKGFLYSLGAEKYLLHIQYHHICMDGWSLGLLLTKLWDYYDRPGTVRVQPELDYERYIQHLNTVKQSEEARSYWRSAICLEAAISLPAQKNASHRTLNRVDRQLDSEVMCKLEGYCKANGFTMAHAIYAAWSILLAKYNDAGDICFGTTVSGRDVGFAGEIEDSIGLYIQTPPLCVNSLSGKDTLASVMQKIKDITLARESHKAYPLADIQAIHNIRHPLFDTIVVIENYPLAKRLRQLSTHVDITDYSIEEKTNFDLCLEVNLLETALLRLSYNTEKYPHYVIANVLKHFEQVLDAIVNNDQLTLARLCLLDEQEYQRLVVDFNHRPPVFSRHTHLIDAWQEVVALHHDSIALCQQDRRVTYAELDALANSVAAQLQARGVRHQELVAIQRRSGVMTIAILIAVAKLGAVYVPLDISTPEERVRSIMSNGIRHLITQDDPDLRDELAQTADGRPRVAYSSDDLLYTIFTSGSTGEPKGVMLEHRTVMNYIQWAIQRYHPVGQRAVYPLFTSLAFDLTVTSIWCPLIGGGTINIIDKDAFNALQDVAALPGLTNIKLTPSQLGLLNPLMNDKTRSLSTFVLGGEQLESKLCCEVTDKLPVGARIFNEYGPTEATVGCMIWQYARGSDTPAVAIGVPIDNAEIYILDRFMQPQPAGIPGELYIGGDVLARGYLGRPDLTADKFVTHPVDHSRIYKTGDLAFFNEQGYVEYIGRKDNQVKLRGYRIELDEIAARIKSYEEGSNAVVVIRTINGEEQLVAYYVSPSGIKEMLLRQFLSAHLPSYMIPTVFQPVSEIKLTINGKVDLSTLPEINVVSERIDLTTSSYKEKVVEIFSSVLEIKKIDLHASFFDLGANSIRLLRITSLLNGFLPRQIKIVDFFTYPNIASLLFYIEFGEEHVPQQVNQSETLSRRDRMVSRRSKMNRSVNLPN